MNREQFYKSKQWEVFRRIVISERVDCTGATICESCGKEIVNRNDLILHHKIELTDCNVNDTSISLNPENIEIICMKCHNKEHNRFNGWKREDKHVYIIYGAPCSGKSTYVNKHAGSNDLIVDMDKIYNAISINALYEKPDSLKSVAFSLRDNLYDVIKYRNGKWLNAFVIASVPTIGERERLIKRLGGAELIYINATQEECMAHAEHDRSKEWKKYIVDWFGRFQEEPTPLS